MQRWSGARGDKRRYRYRRRARLRWDRIALVLALAAVVVFCVVKLVGYGKALIASRKTNGELRTLYYAEPTITPPPLEAAVIAAAPVTEGPVPVATEAPSAPPAPQTTPAYAPDQRLKAVSYPSNAKAQITSRFQTLRQQCPDAVGWLSMGGLVDEAVVQRDNVYYLDHDAKGRSNINGALFMDAAVSMKTRPYTLLIYGHNMKSGAKFGNLRNYENLSFYQASPFVTFDSMYEDGRYVIFAAGKISMAAGDANYVNFFSFTSSNMQERQRLIDTLINSSAFTCSVDVNAQDQLLVLVTCVDQDDERRIVAARRLRDGESETALKQDVSASKSQ